jgi:DNA-binding XRE family transcriptional regulator
MAKGSIWFKVYALTAKVRASALRRNRLRCGWTLAQAAPEIGVSVSTLSKVENGLHWSSPAAQRIRDYWERRCSR